MKPKPNPLAMKQRPVLLIAILAALAAAPLSTQASGSYSKRPPQPGIKQNAFDRDKYTLGKNLFNGKVDLKDQTKPETQLKDLQKLQDQLSKRAAKKTNLTTLAGKLTPEQLDALAYYVSKRFGT